jgi:hypothetical protein
MTKRLSRRSVRLGLTIALAGGALASLVMTQTALSSAARNKTRVAGSGVRASINPSDPTVKLFFSFDAMTSTHGPGTGTGTFSIEFKNFAQLSGVVSCLLVDGDTATIGGVATSGYGYDNDYSAGQRDLTGDWFIAIVQDKGKSAHGMSPDSASSVDWGDRSYFAAGGSSSPTVPFPTFDSLCNSASVDVGTDLFPLLSGDIKIS